MLTRFAVRFTHRLFLATVAFSLATAAQAASPAQYDSAFAGFEQARNGNERAIAQSAEAFAVLLTAEPVNPVLMAYTGASTAMRANTTWLPWKKMTYAEDGMALLDKALGMLTAANNAPLHSDVPASLEVRFIAANTFLAVPGFMNRRVRGAKLLESVANSPLLASSPLAFRVDVWMVSAKLAVAEKRMNDARKYLNEVVKANGPHLEAARLQLTALQS
jgi:hypothetical protein